MKINNNGISNASLNSKEPVQAITPQARNAAAATIMQKMDLYVPSQEWLRIQDLLSKQPEIRGDRVAQANARISTGFYLTKASAHQTAEAMINAVD